MAKLKRISKIGDVYLMAIILLLLIFGVVMAYDATVVYAHNVFGGEYHFLYLQAGWVSLGILTAILTYLLDYHLYPMISLPFLIFSIILLILVFVSPIGVEILGARRWIALGPLTLQPSEVAKLSVILYLSSWFSADIVEKKSLGASKKHNLLGFATLLGLMMLLIVKEPDFVTSMTIIGIGLVIYFVSGAPLSHFILSLPLIFILGYLLIANSPYRLKRLETYLNPSVADPLGAGYHIKQIKIALGSGGIFGLGIGQSRQKYEYLPEVCADSVFAIVGEELGFIGAAALVLVLTFIIYRGYQIAIRAPDQLGRLIATGITTWFALQVFVNLAAMVGLVPLTGITLPFISCGGTVTITTLAGVGILLNVSRQSEEVRR